MRLALTLLFASSLYAANTKVEFDPANPDIGPFPTDFLTTPDTRQRTGVRVNLPLPDCSTRSSDCAEIRLINELDGFNQNARITLKFTGPIQPETLRDNVYIGWLDANAGRYPVYTAPKLSPVNELVYDPATNTAFLKPDEILESSRQYVIIVTSGVKDTAGDPIEASDAYQACFTGTSDYCKKLRAAVDRYPLSSRRIVGASIFTTLSSTAFLEDARRIVQLTPATFRLTSASIASAAIDGITFRQQVRTSGNNRFTDESLPLTGGALMGTSRLAFFAYKSPRFLNDTGIIPHTPTSEVLSIPGATDEIHGHVWLPSAPRPANGYPVLLAGHGFGDSRIGMPTLIAASNMGYAVVTISAVGHGYGPESSYIFSFNRQTLEVPAPGRGRDLDGGGTIDAFEGCVVVGPGSPIIIRDCVRQTAIDYMQLVHAVREGIDLDADGFADLDAGNISYLGQSLGGMYGTLLMAVEPAINNAVLNVPLGSATESGRLAGSQALQFVTTIALGLRQPVLLNRGLSFVDQMPFRSSPVSILNVPGARAIQDFWDRAEWLENLGAPQFYARHLRSATLPGVGIKNILFQMAVGDQTAANSSTSRLIRAAYMQESTSLYRYDIVKSLVPGVDPNPHTFLVPQGPPPTQATGQAAITQALTFLRSGGQTIVDPNPALAPLFEGRSVFETAPSQLPEKP